jgi:FixJ family two-component response regulator
MNALQARREPRERIVQEHAASVFVVDQDLSVRGILESLIRAAGWRAQSFATAEEFLLHRRSQGPGCLVLDLAPPLLDGPAFQEIAAQRKLLPIVFVTALRDVAMTVRAMKAGAVDFLTKPIHGASILAAVQCAVDRSRAALQLEASLCSLRDRYASLSVREREVLSLVVSGLLNKQIGTELGICEVTVKAHRGKVMHKMAADSLAELVSMAARLQLNAG